MQEYIHTPSGLALCRELALISKPCWGHFSWHEDCSVIFLYLFFYTCQSLFAFTKPHPQPPNPNTNHSHSFLPLIQKPLLIGIGQRWALWDGLFSSALDYSSLAKPLEQLQTLQLKLSNLVSAAVAWNTDKQLPLRMSVCVLSPFCPLHCSPVTHQPTGLEPQGLQQGECLLGRMATAPSPLPSNHWPYLLALRAYKYFASQRPSA